MTPSRTAMPAEPTVRVEGVSRRYLRGSEIVTAVTDATFELWPGTMTALIGPSGSGKTTLLNMIIGGDEPDEGAIHGVPSSGDWSVLAIVPQSLGLLDELSMLENIALPLRFGREASHSAIELMDTLGIAALAQRSPSETSLGEQQRAAVARALITAPTILVADEPTSHQDEANMNRVVDSLATCAASGSAVIIATHDLRVIDRCDVVLGLSDGAILPLR
jgi:putative ABC transport system ATP-binding protein